MLDGDDVVDRVPPRFEGQADRLTYLLAEYKYGIYLAVGAAVVLVASGRLGLPQLPEWWSTIVKGVALGAIPAAAVGKYAIVDPWIPDPRYDVLVLESDDGLAPFAEKTPRNLWERRHKGEFSAWSPPAGPFDFVVTRFEYLEDVDELVVEGVNEEIVNPLSIVARNGMLEEVFEDLQYKAAELDQYKARERSRRLEYDREHINSLMAAIEHGLEFDPGTMEAIVDDVDDVDQEEIDADDRDADRADAQEERPTLSEMIDSSDPGASSQPAATDGGRDR